MNETNINFKQHLTASHSAHLFKWMDISFKWLELYKKKSHKGLNIILENRTLLLLNKLISAYSFHRKWQCSSATPQSHVTLTGESTFESKNQF